MSITLVPMKAADVAVVKPWLTDPANSRWLDPFFQEEDLSELQIALFLIQRTKRTFLIHVDGVPVGVAGLTNLDTVNRSAEMWIITGNVPFRSRGVGTHVTMQLLEFAFGDCGLNSVMVRTVDGNPSARIAQRCGFREAGRLRGARLFEGEFRDYLIFDMLRTEFEQSKAERVEMPAR